MDTRSRTDLFLTALFMFVVFLLALGKIHDVDAWLHLSHGKLIYELKGFPEKEVFAYPALDMPFSYSSWLFGVMVYLVHLMFGAAGLVFFKTLIVTAAFYLLLRDALRPYGNYAVATLVLTAILILSQYRFVLRPDIFLMLFLSLSIFCLNAYIYDNKKYLYALPFAHVLWANMHSSIIIMHVPFLAFLAGGIAQRYLPGRREGGFSPSKGQLRTIATVYLASLAFSLISPYSVSQYLFGSQVLSTEWYKQEILELRPPHGWLRTLLYSVCGAVALSFVLNRKREAIIHLLLVVPLMALPFMAARFLFLAFVAAGPVVARNLSAFIEGRGWAFLFRKKAATIVAASAMVLVCSLALAHVKPFGAEQEEFGLGFDYTLMPRGAVKYMDDNNINGRVLNTFHFGQYIAWTGYPRRTVLIDGRGYVPEDVLEKSGNLFKLSVLEELYDRYEAEVLLTQVPTEFHGNPETDALLSRWALVYWDDISLLYLRRGGQYEDIIRKDEYRFTNPSLPVATFINLRSRENPEEVERELMRNISQTGSSTGYLLLGDLQYNSGAYEQAIGTLSRVRRSWVNDRKPLAYEITGDAYRRLGDLGKSREYYEKALCLNESASVLYKMGVMHFSNQEPGKALEYFTRALDVDPGFIDVYPLLMSTYKQLGQSKKAEDAGKAYYMLKASKKTENHFEMGLKAYAEKNYEEALAEFEKALKDSPTNAGIYTNIGYVYYDQGVLEKAREYFALALKYNPGNANAHYGLALVHKKSGEADLAIRHFKEYIEIEPSGFFSRKAKREIEELSR